MHTIQFSCSKSFDPILRALDGLRKMGFTLLGVTVTRSDLLYRTQLQFEVSGNLTVDTFIERLRLHDIVDLAVVKIDAAEPVWNCSPAEMGGRSWTFQ